MADKYANRRESTLTRKERATNVMQTRMPWSEAERYAAELDRFGLLQSGDETWAIAILTEHMKRARAVAIINDLIMYGAMENTRRGEET